MKRAFVFPGQGSQSVGMGKSLSERFVVARTVFERADEVLGFALTELCWSGPEDELQRTENTQPAILTASVAALRVLEERGVVPVAVAGHSLGEYSALVAAGALDFDVALELVRRRGQLMQEAVPLGVGAMAAVLGLDQEEVEAIASDCSREDAVVGVANLNAPGQIVLAGHRAAVEAAADLARQRGAKRSILLPVSAPFHCSLMRPAREAMTPLLEQAEISDPLVPVVTNVDARPATTAAEVRDALTRQIDNPVRWIESVRVMLDELGAQGFVEVGPGAVLKGLIRRIDREAPTLAFAESKDLAVISPEVKSGV